MAFGDSARKAKEVSENRNAVNMSTEPIYFPIVDGSNFFRLFPGDDVILFREWWFDVPVLVKDKEGNERFEIKSRPAILSVFNSSTGYYDSAEQNQQDPLSEWFYAKTEDERKALKKFIRTRFAVNVINRNLVTRNEDGTFIPDSDGEPLNSVQILTHSGGKEGGKHVLQSIMDCVGDMRNAKGKKIESHMADLLIRKAGSGYDTRYAVSVGYNQEEIDFDSFVKYDIESFYKPFPFDAIRDMMSAEKDWNAIRDEYNIPQWPKKYGTSERNIPAVVDDTELPV